MRSRTSFKASVGTLAFFLTAATGVFLVALVTTFLSVVFLVAILILLVLLGPGYSSFAAKSRRGDDNYPLRLAKSCMKSTNACTPATGMAL